MAEDYPPSVIPQEPAMPPAEKVAVATAGVGAFFWDFLETIVFALAVFVIVYLFIAQPHQVQGDSMKPNFLDGEYILTNKILYHFEKPQRGDVIIFKSPTQKDFIKRVIAIPGETFKVQDCHVYVNDKLLPEAYLDSSVCTNEGMEFRNGVSQSVPEDHYIVLGDNRPRSSDSRDWGMIKTSDIIGKAWLIYWPFSHFGPVPHARYQGF